MTTAEIEGMKKDISWLKAMLFTLYPIVIGLYLK